MSYLVVTEKPSVAKTISTVLGATKRGDGFFSGNGYTVSWCIGHLVELAPAKTYGERYAKWKQEDLPILPSPWKFTVSQCKKKQLDILKKLMHDKDIEAVICATDAGREGEYIFRLVYQYCKCTKPIHRLWISSLEDSAIRDGFENLRDGSEYDNLYRAAQCRSGADWLVGINATRLFSCLYGATLNVGRVQTPTLALLAEREHAIVNFVKEPFYTPELTVDSTVLQGEKHKDKSTAEAVRSDCEGKSATVTSVERKEKSIAPPKLYDLTTLQREANRLYGYTAQQTLDYTQALYEKKLCTYPRTDSRFLTNDMAETVSVLVHSIAAMPMFETCTNFFPDVDAVCDNSKVSDHHAVIPTLAMTNADLAELPVGERNILHMLSARLLCALAEKHLYCETIVTAECAGHKFIAKGKTVTALGWKEIEGLFLSTLKEKPKGDDIVSLPEFSEGQQLDSSVVTIREGHSSPPKHFSEDTLLSAMETAGAEDMPEEAERRGLGTPATRASMIEKLIKSGLVLRKNKQLLPTEKGKNLISVLPDTVKSPALTAEWEHRLLEVERGKLTDTEFMSDIHTLVKSIIAEHDTADNTYKALFENSAKGKAVGKCPRCGGDVCESKKGFFCSGQSCGFAIWKDNKFFATKKKKLDTKIVGALLKQGSVSLSGLYSERTGKNYDAVVVLDDTGRYVNFKLDFNK